jgi:threonine/homoserine efflux transporter RhtA
VKRRLIQFIQNVDALVPLILGVAVSVLGLLDLASPRTVDNSILIVLAVLSFALLRDRWNKDLTEKNAQEASAETLGVMRTLQATTAPLAELDQRVARMHVTVEGLVRQCPLGR